MELDNLRAQYREMEKKQRKFDQQLAEERGKTATAIAERDQLAQDVSFKHFLCYEFYWKQDCGSRRQVEDFGRSFYQSGALIMRLIFLIPVKHCKLRQVVPRPVGNP